jgi:hypothetical protein
VLVTLDTSDPLHFFRCECKSCHTVGLIPHDPASASEWDRFRNSK